MARTIAKDHDKKRTHILKMAAHVFAQEGFDRASMTVLAKACGISKANIYHYYDSKDSILFDVLDTYLRTLRTRICGLDLDDLSAETQLRVVVREILMAYQGADDEHRVQSSGFEMLSSEQQAALRAYQRDMVHVVSTVLQRNAPLVFEGDPTRLRATTMSVFGMLNWYFMWQSGADTSAREKYAEMVADLTLGGLPNLK